MNAAKIRHFWDWFRARADKIRVDPGVHAEEIDEMIGRLHDGLAWEMGGPNEGAWDFTLRTESSELRYVTHQIVSAAPAIPGWNILAWKPAHGTAEWKISLNEGEKTFDLAKFTASVEVDARFPFLNLTIACPEFSTPPKDEVDRYAAFLGLDILLGEKLVEDALELIEVQAAPAGPVPAGRLREEVDRLLIEARSRTYAFTGNILTGQGGTDEKPLFVMQHELDLSLMAAHPWRVDAELRIKDPNEYGLPGKKELGELQSLNERMGEVIDRNRSALMWSHRTTEGFRTSSFYVDDPLGSKDALSAEITEAGFEHAVGIVYDPRWQEYRRYYPVK